MRSERITPDDVARNLYITATEAQSGKSIVALGLMEALAARSRRIGFFRPIVHAGARDSQIELIRRRYDLAAGYDEMHALTVEEAGALIATGRQDELEQRVFDAYKRLERECEVLVCEGTDYSGAVPALDFELNATLANALGCPVLAVIRGDSPAKIAAKVRVARGQLAQRGCAFFGVIVNRVPRDALDAMRTHSVTYDRSEPMYVLAEEPELANPTVSEIARALGAEVLVDPGTMRRAVRAVRIGAMNVEHFVSDLLDGTLVIVPGDRADILVASLAASLSTALPSVAGLLLTGAYAPAPTIRRLLDVAPFPVLQVAGGTYATAAAVHDVVSVIGAEDERKIATALGVFEAGVDPRELTERIAVPRPVRVTPRMFQHELIERAKLDRQHIVLAEGDDERILHAADILLRRQVVELTILGEPARVRARGAALGLTLEGAHLVEPASSPLRREFAAAYHELRKHKGMTAELAYDTVAEPSYFGTFLVQSGAVDGMVSGAAHTTADTIRPAFEVIRALPEVSVVSSVFFMCLADRVLVYGDCAVNPAPDGDQLADIAISSADTAASFGIDVRVAMLSYSTGDSGRGEGVERVRLATALVRERRPDLRIEGPIQYDAAVDASVAALKLPDSDVAGQATVFVFPDLDTGNVSYKAVQRSAGAVAVGPVLQGLRKPVNDLSRGCTVTDIVNTVAITAIQAQSGSGRGEGALAAGGGVA